MNQEEWDGIVEQALTLTTQELADALAMVQADTLALRNVERDLAAALGKREGVIQGNLSDGRQFTLKRAADRKEWDHEDWKRDARRNIVNQVLEARALPAVADVVYDDGEVLEVALGAMLHEAIAEAQEVHGSTPPRTTALKRLGLYASDYCTSTPGGWRFNAIKVDTTPETTTTKD